MNYIAANISNAISFAVVIAAYMWLLSISPFLRWLTKITALTAWGIVSVGGVATVIIVVYLPHARHFEATVALIAGAIFYVPWFIFGLPELITTIKNRLWTNN
jgi:hypothetical protein